MFILDKSEILVLKTISPSGVGRKGLRYPKCTLASITAPDWDPSTSYAGGLHGLPWGVGNVDYLSSDPDALWVLLIVDTRKNYIYGSGELENVCKFKTGIVGFFGYKNVALTILHEHMPPGTVTCIMKEEHKEVSRTTSGKHVIQKNGNECFQLAADYAYQIAGFSSSQYAGDMVSQRACERSKQKAGLSSNQTTGDHSDQRALDFAIQRSKSYSIQNAGCGSIQSACNRSRQTADSASLQIAGERAIQIAEDGSVQRATRNANQTAKDHSTQISEESCSQTAGSWSTQLTGGKSIQIAGAESIQMVGDNSIQVAGVGTVQIGSYCSGNGESKKLVSIRIVTEIEANKPYLFKDGVWTERAGEIPRVDEFLDYI